VRSESFCALIQCVGSDVLERLTPSLLREISQYVYELHCDEAQVFLGIFQQIASALNRCIYCLLEIRIQQEKHVSELKEPE
jgi:predicted house-cleaning noncanonical NTP pyrophosphatase (MazG superfamily)